MVTFHIITLFPDGFSYLNESILGRAQRNKKIKITFYNPRDFTPDKHRTTDDRSYGGGPGMVMKAEPVLKAAAKALGKKKNAKVIFFSAQGKQFTNTHAAALGRKYKDIILIAGHYEGVDERVAKTLRQDQGKSSLEKISIGPYILTGGELPAMVVIDAVTRQLFGVLGKGESLEESRVAAKEVYTRPETLEHQGKKYRVPKVLLSGDHKKIDEWRAKKQKR